MAKRKARKSGSSGHTRAGKTARRRNSRPARRQGSLRGAAPATQKLNLMQVRHVFRLIGQVRAHGADPAQWRRFMVSRLRRLLTADMVISTELSFLAPSAARQRALHQLAAGGTLPRSLIKGAILRDRGFGIDENGQAWHIDEEHEEFRPEDYQVLLAPKLAPDGRLSVRPMQHLRAGRYFILSQFSLPHADTVDQLGVYRFDMARPFGPVEARVLRLLHTELGRLWRAQALRKTRDPRVDLAPRLSQTLTLLVAGSSEKQVARELGISPHTVHNYVKALHRRYKVASRGELLAKAAAQNIPDFRPRLTIEMPR